MTASASAPSGRLVAGPFNRVEGDLEVRLDIADGRVRSAEVVSPMYRGFEQMLVGREPLDALVIVPRICGICSVSQSMAAAHALAALAGVQPPPNGLHALNLMAGAENAADHLTHLYLFFLPDFTRAAYAGRAWFDDARTRFSALAAAPGASAGVQSRKAVAARARWFEIVGTLGGKWPHTHSVQPGGSARAIDAGEKQRLRARLREFRAFLEAEVYAAPLDEVLALDSLDALERWRAADPMRGDMRCWLTIAADVGAAALGAGPGRLISAGALRGEDGAPRWSGGVWHADAGVVRPLRLERIGEDATRAWLEDGPPRHPSLGRTEPHADKPGAYTWCKAPRLDGEVVETGALARQVVAGQPLARDAARRLGANVATRVLGRFIELAALVPALDDELAAIRPGQPFHVAGALPAHGQACGMHEAARGTLGHWIRVESGRIAAWQIVAPTTWNFSPRDAAGVPGALEAALVGTPVQPGETTPLAVQHVVRSFDPCMVCTAH